MSTLPMSTFLMSTSSLRDRCMEDGEDECDVRHGDDECVDAVCR